MPETVRVQVLFTEETPHGTYTDALYYTPEEFDALKDADKDAAKQARVAAYVDKIVNAPPPKEYSKDEWQATVDKIAADLTYAQAKLEEAKNK